MIRLFLLTRGGAFNFIDNHSEVTERVRNSKSNPLRDTGFRIKKIKN